jgi:hypothetical protein
MENGIQKLLRKLVLKKYPMYLDVHVQVGSNGHPYARLRACYDVFVIVLEQDVMEDRDIEVKKFGEVKDYINNLGKYMDVRICGIYREVVVNEEEWEEMKSDETPN